MTSTLKTIAVLSTFLLKYVVSDSTLSMNGFCIDLSGSNENVDCETLRGATCGALDTNFVYNDVRGKPSIQSMLYAGTVYDASTKGLDTTTCAPIPDTTQPGGCLTANGFEVGATVRLNECKNWRVQKWIYTKTQKLILEDRWNPGHYFCLGMGEWVKDPEADGNGSGRGNGFLRDLTLMDCHEAPAWMLQWDLLPEPTVNVLDDVPEVVTLAPTPTHVDAGPFILGSDVDAVFDEEGMDSLMDELDMDMNTDMGSGMNTTGNMTDTNVTTSTDFDLATPAVSRVGGRKRALIEDAEYYDSGAASFTLQSLAALATAVALLN